MRFLLPALVLCASTSSAQIVFAPPTLSPVGADPGGLLTGDLDGDGDPDLVISRPSTGGGVGSVALNAGDGTFTEVQTLPGSAIVMSDLDDLDGDGVLDLVMAQFGFEVQPVLRFGLGDGTFGPEVILPYEGSLLTIRTGDVDGDGDRDLVLGSRSIEALSIQGHVTALLNDGTGAFPIEVLVSSLEADRLEVGDMNGDGLDDVVFATTPATTTLAVALSLGAGAFALGPACATCSGLAGYPNDLALADVDLDGDLDVFLLLVPLIAGPVSLFTNDGAAGLSAPTQTGLVFAQAFEVVDLDGDDLPDLLGKDLASTTAALTHHELRVHRNLGGGTFGELLEVTVCDLPFDLVTADFDGDGRTDAAVVDPSIDSIVVAKNATYFASQPFVDLGKNLVGSEGFPVQLADGSLQPASTLTLTVAGARPLASALLFLGLSAIDAPFKGGTLVPSPDVVVTPVGLDAAGATSLPIAWPSGVPSDLDLFWQFWISDAAGPKGFAATNAIRATTP